MSVIRPAEPRDACAIAAILNQIIRDTTITFNSVEKTEAEVADGIAQADAYFVAELDNAVVGYASFGPFRKGIGYEAVKEHSIGLHPDVRVAGIGSKLLENIEKSAKSMGVRNMVAGVSIENDAGLKFHAKHGYERVGHLPAIGQKFNRSIDLVLMQKTL